MGEDKKIDESTKQESMFTIISQWISVCMKRRKAIAFI